MTRGASCVHIDGKAPRVAAAVAPSLGSGDVADQLSSTNRIRITVDRGLCIGSGDCVDTAPDVFELDGEEKAVVIDPDGAPVDVVIEAAGNCPVTAILVIGEEGDLYP